MISETQLKLKVQICLVEPDDFSKKENIFEKNDEEICEKYLIPYKQEGNFQETVFLFVFLNVFQKIL